MADAVTATAANGAGQQQQQQQHRPTMQQSPDETGRRIVPVLACVLNQLCARNDQLVMDPDSVTKFHALRPPSISILDYLERIGKYSACSGECFVLALVYIDRIISSNHNFTVNSLNVHRLLISSVMLAAKFFDDQYFNNAYYAKVGGVPCHEINSLEVEFLFMINFSLFVTTGEYEQYYTELCNHTVNSGCTCQTDAGVPPLEPIPRAISAPIPTPVAPAVVVDAVPVKPRRSKRTSTRRSSARIVSQ
ncbi:Cyclin [Plasmodiophora brassicae]|uniref:Cyclin n=1 Tax=Plasmodiophora brassicae TaxID=37360 RepID=A0A0G4IY42_PLABS|nr:hypothetical protein PBRA_007725 [Plasmodiophora brassicae]SPQ99030.1 unnamed protein product [Plasmodiophora brassicae]